MEVFNVKELIIAIDRANTTDLTLTQEEMLMNAYEGKEVIRMNRITDLLVELATVLGFDNMHLG
jgi:hypothetical protein